jgi:hypothetical protein
VADDSSHNEINEPRNWFSKIFQAGAVHGNVNIYPVGAAALGVGAVIVVTGFALGWFAPRPSAPSAAAPSSTSRPDSAAIRLAGPVRMDESAFDKVIPSRDLEYEDVLENFSVRTPETKGSRAEWLTAHGAVGVGEARWSFGLDGLLDQTVQITEARPVDVECGAPLGGTYMSNPDAGRPPERLTIDIDKPNAQFLISSPDLDQPPVPLFERKIDLPKNTTQPILLVAQSAKAHCKFRVRFDYTANGEQKQFTVDQNGKPFEVTGKADPDQYGDAYLTALRQCKTSYKIPYSKLEPFQGC